MKRKRKPLKKRSFASFFFRVWIPFLCLTLIGLYAIFSLFSSYVADATLRMQENQFNIYLANTITDINKGYMAYSVKDGTDLLARDWDPDIYHDEQYWAEIQFQLAMTGSFGPASLYQIDENGYHEVMNSLERYYMAVQFGEDTPCFYSCDKSVITELLNNNADGKIRKKDIEKGNIFIRLNDFYINGSEFIPGSFDLYDGGTYVIGFGEDDRLEGNFKNYVGTIMNPDTPPEDYIHFTVSDNVTISIHPILLGSKQTAEERWNEIRDKNPSAGIPSFRDNLDSDYRFNIFYGDKGGFLVYNLSWNRLDSPIYGGYDGQITAVSVGYFNALESFGTIFLIISLFLLLFVTMICVIIALPTYRDYRERYRMEQYRKNMTDNLAHDLKSPLMAISGYAENMKLDALADKKDYYLDSIIKTTSYMNEILCDMFELESLENDQDKMKRERVDLKDITDSVIRRYENNIAQKNLRLSVQGEALMEGDSYYMGRAIDNLVGNAVKFTPKDGEITIRMENGSYEITNTGVTIPPEKLSKICEPFVKGSSERSNQSGTGLGLAIVKNILALHNTDLSIESAKDITKFSFHFHMKDSLSE